MGKRVLIAPLHWGLGHATRCIPIIQQQIDHGNEVIIAAKGGPRGIIMARFPDLQFIDIPFMEITYPRDGNMSRHFFWRGPSFLHSIWREHKTLQRLIRTMKIDLVISDSRFGLWSRKTKCIFITHQVQILSPHFQGLINVLNRWVMRQYKEVWIPDYEAAPGLAGILSHPEILPKNARYIGPLSRFSEPVKRQASKWKSIAIISGPESQRSLFEVEMARQFIESEEPALILRGKPDSDESREIGQLKVVTHLDDQSFIQALAQSEEIFARSGYSTIMDLHVLGLTATFYPTPGQTEQEYLAQLHGN
mgnify:CR=1 FL=1